MGANKIEDYLPGGGARRKSIWAEFLAKCVDQPGKWHRSYPMRRQIDIDLIASYFKRGILLHPETIEKRVLKGKVGTWYYIKGVDQDGLKDWDYYIWFKFVRDGGKKGPKLPPTGGRYRKTIRRIIPHDNKRVRTKRSDGHD